MNYSKLFPDGLHCAICGQPRIVKDAHVAMHCERGEARGEWIKGVTYFVPMGADEPENRPVYSGTRKLDPVLARLVRAEQRKQKAGAR